MGQDTQRKGVQTTITCGGGRLDKPLWWVTSEGKSRDMSLRGVEQPISPAWGWSWAGCSRRKNLPNFAKLFWKKEKYNGYIWIQHVDDLPEELWCKESKKLCLHSLKHFKNWMLMVLVAWQKRTARRCLIGASALKPTWRQVSWFWRIASQNLTMLLLISVLDVWMSTFTPLNTWFLIWLIYVFISRLRARFSSQCVPPEWR